MGTHPAHDEEQVKISVLIPLRKGWNEKIDHQIDALRRQTLLTPDFEVILVDLAREKRIDPPPAKELPFDRRILTLPGATRTQGLNQAIQVARGEICLFLEEGACPQPGLVGAHLQAQTREGGVLGIGRTVYATTAQTGWHGRQYVAWVNSRRSKLEENQRELDWRDCSLENLSVPREAILDVGGFDVELGPGAGPDLAFRLMKQGVKCADIPDAIATREEDRHYFELAAEGEAWGVDSVRLWRKHPAMLPGLFGHFFQTSPRGVLLKRALLTLRVPSSVFTLVSLFFGENETAGKWFEFLADYWFWRGVRRAIPDRQTWNRLTQGVLVLMYHAIGEEHEPASRYILPQTRFAAQMRWLKRLGFQVICLEDYLCCLRDFQLPPEKSIVITLDDGYLDNYSLAFPILRSHGFPATIFLITGAMGKTNTWDPDGVLVDRPVISWEQAREMQPGGITFGAHTRTHPFLSEVSLEQAQQEIQGSKEDIEAELSARDLAFAYPHGVSTPEARELVERAGLLGAVTSKVGVNTPDASPFALRRVEVRGSFSLLKFLSLLWGTVDAGE